LQALDLKVQIIFLPLPTDPTRQDQEPSIGFADQAFDS
jgi:hypothetical protein